jgi:hypothetical protein
MAIVLFILVLSYRSMQPIYIDPLMPTITTTPIPDGWHLYTDINDHFAIALPKSWTAARSTGNEVMGQYEKPFVSFDILIFSFSSAEPGNAPESAAISLVMTPIANPTQHMIMCSNYHMPNAMLGEFPAYHPNLHQWIVDTQQGQFNLAYTINTQTTENSPSDPLLQVVNQAIASFQPLKAVPLSC